VTLKHAKFCGAGLPNLGQDPAGKLKTPLVGWKWLPTAEPPHYHLEHRSVTPQSTSATATGGGRKFGIGAKPQGVWGTGVPQRGPGRSPPKLRNF